MNLGRPIVTMGTLLRIVVRERRTFSKLVWRGLVSHQKKVSYADELCDALIPMKVVN